MHKDSQEKFLTDRLADWSEFGDPLQDMAKTSQAALHSVYNIDCGKETLVSQIFFKGADFIWCTEGAFRFEFSEREPLILKEGEFLVLFPRRFVTIKGLTDHSSLHGGTLAGKLQEEFLLQLGFCDGFHCSAPYSPENMMQIQRLLDKRKEDSQEIDQKLLHHVAYMLRTVIAQQSYGKRGLFLRAARRINIDFLSGNATVKSLADDLNCSSTYLNLAFKDSGYRGPGEYLSRLQCWRGCQLLKYTQLTIGQIAVICGYSNGTSFARFMQGWLNATPTAIRNGLHYLRRPPNTFPTDVRKECEVR